MTVLANRTMRRGVVVIATAALIGGLLIGPTTAQTNAEPGRSPGG